MTLFTKSLSSLALLGALLLGGSASAGEPAPDFSLRDINGKEVSLSSYKLSLIHI